MRRPKSLRIECCRASFDRGGHLRLPRCRKSPASWPEACCAWPRRSLLGRITSTSPSAAPSADHAVGASMDMDVQIDHADIDDAKGAPLAPCDTSLFYVLIPHARRPRASQHSKPHSGRRVPSSAGLEAHSHGSGRDGLCMRGQTASVAVVAIVAAAAAAAAAWAAAAAAAATPLLPSSSSTPIRSMPPVCKRPCSRPYCGLSCAAA